MYRAQSASKPTAFYQGSEALPWHTTLAKRQGSKTLPYGNARVARRYPMERLSLKSPMPQCDKSRALAPEKFSQPLKTIERQKNQIVRWLYLELNSDSS